MIRITRLVSSNRIADILNLDGVCKVELKQGKQKGLRKPISKVQIYLCADKILFNNYMCNIRAKAIEAKNNSLRTTADTALHDGFIKESAFSKLNYPMFKRYKDYCNKYSQEFFNAFGNERRIMGG